MIHFVIYITEQQSMWDLTALTAEGMKVQS
jgi:hypothetical protein